MNPLILTAVNPFDVRAALLARHAQHPVVVHFPIALFIASALFEVLAAWRKQPALASVAYYNLFGAALSIPITIATGLAAWQFQLEGAALKGNLLLHLLLGLITATIILILLWKRFRLRDNNESPRVGYFALMTVGLAAIILTGHLGGILSGVEGP
ncbi:MAG TPA: DUF2231 domain-containing protein [Chthoniobacterales bacterium]|nr:DUF2231 domain-containing protein [Chthoniobacterales bacterium]